MYEESSSNTTLYGHTKKFHIDEFLTLAESEGWQIFIPSVNATFNAGYILKTLHNVLKQPGITIHKLPPAPHPEPGDVIPIHVNRQPSTSLDTDLPDFFIAALHEYIVKFIIADDQVSYIYDYPSMLMHVLVYQCD